jgi:hypothetical protein
MKFTSEQEAIKYYHKNSKDIKILMPRQIVQLITPSSNQSPAKVSEK